MTLPDLYLFREGKRQFYRRVKDIDYVKGEGNCSKFHFTDGSSHMENKNIGLHRKHLEAFSFFQQIHRSFVVNLKAIKGITPDGKVLLKSGAELLCSEKRLPALLELFPIAGR